MHAAVINAWCCFSCRTAALTARNYSKTILVSAISPKNTAILWCGPDQYLGRSWSHRGRYGADWENFAAALKVQYTPTLIIFNESNKTVFRANGYYPPEKFNTLLDYAGQKLEQKLTYQAYLEKVDPQPSKGELHTDIINIQNPYNLQQALEPGKHLLVLFEQKKCKTCDELHDDMFRREESKELLARFNIGLLDMWSDEAVIRPDGKSKNTRLGETDRHQVRTQPGVFQWQRRRSISFRRLPEVIPCVFSDGLRVDICLQGISKFPALHW